MLELSPLVWTVTIALVLVLLAVDLILATVRPHRVGFREAAAWSVFYVGVAIAFGVWLTFAYGGDFGTQYFAGYLVEKSLSVDNLFVFVIIMSTFAVPEKHQHKVLTFGIILALVMRAVFIALGAALLSLFSFVFLLFGLLLRPKSENDKCARHLRSASGIAVFVSERNDKRHWIEAGRCYERFALQATALGIRTAFLNQPVEVAPLRSQFATWLNLGARRPDLVVRFGRGPEMPRSLRRPIEQVLA